MPGNVMQAQFAGNSRVGALFPAQRTQVFFSRPAKMQVHWYTQGRDGKPSYSLFPLETPGRYNFAQGAIYRLKLTHIEGRPGLELYPTLEVVPTSPNTNEFLAHNSVPLEFTDDDFKQVVDRNYIVKVIYLPDPAFQDVAGTGPDEIVSTKLDPGQNPIQEALRRGSIMLVLRIGNIDQEVPSSPSLSSPVGGGAPSPTTPPPGMGVPPTYQVPYFGPPFARPGLVPVPSGALPGMPPGMVPPGVALPGVVAPGLGAEGERKNPNQLHGTACRQRTGQEELRGSAARHPGKAIRQSRERDREAGPDGSFDQERRQRCESDIAVPAVTVARIAQRGKQTASG